MRSKCQTMTKKLLLTITMLSLDVIAQIGPVTTYDGVLDQSFNRFVTFSGTSGLQYERDILEKAEQYTITTWVKFDELPWAIGSDMVLFDLQPGFNCKLKVTKRLSCKPKDQFSLEDPLSFVFEPLIDHWYIFVLQVSQE